MPVTELVRQEQSLQQYDEGARFRPVMSLEQAVERREIIVQAVQRLMKQSTKEISGDYGIIPGTKEPTLLQPGADKLCNLFGLVPAFEVLEKVLDWTGEHHGGEPFFYYEVKCKLFRGEYLMGEGIGSCNSREAKYRWRKADRVCPKCGAAAIKKSSKEPGWYCWAKIDGCGRKFREDDPDITRQQTGNIPNPDIADAVNTIQKIANKRAKIAATLNATSAHEFFTQDVEDVSPQSIGVDQRQQSPAGNTTSPAESAPAPPEEDPAVLALWSTVGKALPKFINALRQLKSEMAAECGADKPAQDILAMHDMAGFEDNPTQALERAGIEKARFALRDMFLTLQRWRSANTPPPPPVDPKDDWVPSVEEMKETTNA